MPAKSAAPKQSAKKASRPRRKRSWLWRLFWCGVILVLATHAFVAAAFVALKWVNPPTTAVQAQRRIEAMFGHKKYSKHRSVLPLKQIAPDLQHAVMAAEDMAFYQHDGINWDELEVVLKEYEKRGRVRGGSTISMQLVKNLFFGTWRNPFRKVAEFTMTPMAEAILGKQRILSLYLNNIEWGPGIFGAEEAARRYYGVSASKLTREEAERLAAIIPSPRRWKPQHMDRYAAEIDRRMRVMGW